MATLVVLCSHNGERFVREQIASIRCQTSPVDAIYVFDFGSTDATPEILDRFSADGITPPVRVRSYADAPGAASSFLEAFRQLANFVASTDCIFFADQDDVWLPHKVQAVVARFPSELAKSDTKAVMLFHDVAIVDQRLRTLADTYYNGSPFAIPRDLEADRLLLANPVVGHTIAASGALLRIVAAHIKSRDYLMHDWAVVLIASRVGTIGFLPSVLSLYRQHDANVLGAFGRRRPTEIIGRTLRFAHAVVRQTVNFERDLGRINTDLAAMNAFRTPRRVDRWLSIITRRLPSMTFLALACLAAARGPTWPRRALAVALLLAAMPLPFARSGDR